MTYEQARAALPPCAKVSCTFGNPGDYGPYSEWYRATDGRRFEILRPEFALDNGYTVQEVGQ